MITMQELTQHFKPILTRTIDTKEPTDNGIKMPYKNIAKVCIEFAPGESYSFFGSAKECALSLWRINLMWQLAKKGVPTHLTARKLELKWRGKRRRLCCLAEHFATRYFMEQGRGSRVFL